MGKGLYKKQEAMRNRLNRERIRKDRQLAKRKSIMDARQRAKAPKEKKVYRYQSLSHPETEARLVPPFPAHLLNRFHGCINKTTTCWEWKGCMNALGYGLFNIGRGQMLAHRASYVILRGPIPKGLTLDHLCRKPICVNPDHLEPVTLAENIRRGHTQSHCDRGHEISITPSGRRVCRTCDCIRHANWYARKKQVNTKGK